MRHIKSILVPIDGSVHSPAALEQAMYIAKLARAKLTVLYVIDLNTAISALERVTLNSYLPDDIDSEGQKILDQARLTVEKEQLKADYQMLIGNPAQKILKYAQENKIDLIVMGSRGLGAIKQILMGSVSQYLVANAPCPVLINR